MAAFVKITKNGIIPYEWNDKIEDYEPENESTSNLEYLRSICYFDDDLTLGDIFNAVEKDPDLMKFIGGYSWCDIKEMHDEAKKPTTKNSTVTSLVISPYADFYLDMFEGVFIDFSGVNSKYSNWSISLTPVNQIVHLPIKINPKTKISIGGELYKEFTYNPSLLEVLDGIYHDISFYGTSEEKEKLETNITEMVNLLESE